MLIVYILIINVLTISLHRISEPNDFVNSEFWNKIKVDFGTKKAIVGWLHCLALIMIAKSHLVSFFPEFNNWQITLNQFVLAD